MSPPNHISTPELLQSVLDLADELGRAPKAREYGEMGRYSAPTVSNRFGGWNAALRAAGLEIHKNHNISEDELLNDLHRVEQKIGRTPSQSEYEEHGRYAVSVYPYRFESWNNAIQRAGLKVNSARGNKSALEWAVLRGEIDASAIADGVFD